MKFDIVIGNPPYNDEGQSMTKVNGSKMSSQGKILPGFIEVGCKLMKYDGSLYYICPPSSEKYFRKNNTFIHKIGFVHQKNWGKRIATFWWEVKKTPSLTKDVFVDKGINKMLNYDPEKHKVNKDVQCLYLYNFSTVVKVGFTYFHYADGRYSLPPTELNKKNLHTLISFIQPWMQCRINSWSSVNKKIKYEWLCDVDFEITEQDIINHYQLTLEEVKFIKS